MVKSILLSFHKDAQQEALSCATLCEAYTSTRNVKTTHLLELPKRIDPQTC
jgi:hypothetical protein